MKPEPVLILSDARGVFIPRDFTNNVARERVENVSEDDWTILAEGPDHDEYWDTWDIVLTDATVADDKGRKYKLYQEGDLWLIPVGMTWSDTEDFFVWPDEEDAS